MDTIVKHLQEVVAGMTKEKTQWKEFLETISVLQWVLTFLLLALFCIILMVYLLFTSLWPLSTLYFMWMVMDWETPERGGRRTAFVRKWRVWEQLRDFFPIKLMKTAELSPNKNYILGCHPHGIMSAGAFTCFSTESCGFTDMFPGMRCTLAILAGLFRVPLFREYIMGAGLCPVSKPSLVHLLSKSGKGNAVVIVIGGAAESLSSSPGANTVVVRHRKGFVRMALEFGADLVPVYSFGENELFQQVIFSDGSLGRRLQDLFKKIVGFAPCLFVGERLAVMPYRTPITTVVGSPISVPKCVTPTEEEVDHYHKLYMDALSKLFHEHKVSCGLPESHKLRII
ncbi:2-acylglycerol O-acyltransferase 3b isoform X1 [Acanthopagrus latus]|uniref:2-acylglycerol O-acyltransferase 3b isoform X1 n=2 Tax=Acanthopagrus latus TaxID=8177 RepID=UPI00187D0586|nr:2-acylglycerol O-acyltransferase 3b isoform X1 [Acanthopagrus latus]XP_036975356.1 2-acylglycerol O-acyltransferase 3b isoform X1 [Acanthopagrus latus]XP_036975357.1 2-acylglycerol O-acyltransferase 3b isoform X1 [Acanthopagrus latus]